MALQLTNDIKSKNGLAYYATILLSQTVVLYGLFKFIDKMLTPSIDVTPVELNYNVFGWVYTRRSIE